MEILHAGIHFAMAVTLAILTHQYWTLLRYKQQPCFCNTTQCPSITDTRRDFPDQLLDFLSVSSVEIPKVDSDDNDVVSSTVQINSSSVWCWGDHHTNRFCQFRNLYYLPTEDEFAFVHGDDSVYMGLPDNRYDPTLLDMSSVRNHNTQYFNYMDISHSRATDLLRNVTIVNVTSLIFRRFHPDNLMHVLHDDLLPMYHTLTTAGVEQSANGSDGTVLFTTRLVFMEGWQPGPYRDLYELFSTYAPVYKEDLQSERRPVCFRNTFVGLLKQTTWYQYGFTEPQGPIDGHNITAREVRRFCQYVRARLGINETANKSNKSGTVVILSRKYNRLILNELELAVRLAQVLQMKVFTIGAETHLLTDIIRTVSGATVLIGMHGSLMALAMFLHEGAMLVELFPYAVNPAHYTPYRTLARLPGMVIHYVAWQNLDQRMTVVHPSRPWDQGGISHLDPKEQMRILTSREVPRHLCCRDPEWLFRIYQDTVVDIEGVLHLVEMELKNVPLMQGQIASANSQKIFPSHVRNVICESNANDADRSLLANKVPSLYISWEPPANLEYIDFTTLKYEVWIQERGQDDYMAWILSKCSHVFTTGIQSMTNYNIWVRCIIDEQIIGPFNVENISCST